MRVEQVGNMGCRFKRRPFMLNPEDDLDSLEWRFLIKEYGLRVLVEWVAQCYLEKGGHRNVVW